MIESEMSRGVWLSRSEAESTSLHEALERYLAEIVPAKKSATREASTIRMLIALPLALRPLASIRGVDIAALRDEWLQHYAPASVVRHMAVLSHVFSVTRKEWGMESLANPVSAVRKPSVSNARTRRITTLAGEVNKTNAQRSTPSEELDCVIAASNSALLPTIIVLAVETAMRRSEIVSLCWEYVDLVRRVAHLPATKNGSPRDVPLSSKAVEVLRILQERSEAMKGRVCNLRADAVTRAFDRAVKRARIQYVKGCKEQETTPDERFLVDLHFHDLRHEATSRLAEIFPMHELTRITGHKDPRMLMRYYHPKAENLAKRLA
ncbi:site-specific integrase [Delftia sp. Lp-1]|uniref:tyrosine-type recombinase/integrase n=1 Tax=Delftia sp. Lp-1 TaxID=682863 RepID=UPI001E500D5D|nr:site-specific integrase [Delftia sp. Lp-1]MCB4787350.1 site-specific integrase [Delftia sp. Lp-1]